MNDLIGPRQFGWSANFENLMKAHAWCARAMKLSIPVNRTSPIAGPFQIVYLWTYLSFPLFHRSQTRPHRFELLNELSGATRRFSKVTWRVSNFKTLDLSSVSNRSSFSFFFFLLSVLVQVSRISRHLSRNLFLFFFHSFFLSFFLSFLFQLFPNIRRKNVVQGHNTSSRRNNSRVLEKSMQKFILVRPRLFLYLLPGEFIE